MIDEILNEIKHDFNYLLAAVSPKPKKRLKRPPGAARGNTTTYRTPRPGKNTLISRENMSRYRYRLPRLTAKRPRLSR